MIETNIRSKLDLRENIVHWMIRWAAMVASRYLVGKDGRAAYERQRGRRCRMPIAIFGEKIFYKALDNKKEKGKMDAQWETGIWLGVAPETNESLVGTSAGVTRAYAIKRRPSEERWDKDMIKSLVGTHPAAESR